MVCPLFWIMKEQTDWELFITYIKGVVVSEGDKLVYVHVPREGVALSDFFGSNGKSVW